MYVETYTALQHNVLSMPLARVVVILLMLLLWHQDRGLSFFFLHNSAPNTPSSACPISLIFLIHTLSVADLVSPSSSRLPYGRELNTTFALRNDQSILNTHTEYREPVHLNGGRCRRDVAGAATRESARTLARTAGASIPSCPDAV